MGLHIERETMELQQQTHILASREPPGFFASLAEKARALPTGNLVALSLFSWVAVALWTIPDGLPHAVPAPFLSIGTFGLWGVMERIRMETTAHSPVALVALDVGQRLAAVAGSLAMLFVVFSALGVALGALIL